MKLEDLEKIEKKLLEIRELLHPEDSPYVCDVIVTSISDELLADLIQEMLIRMGYRNKIIIKVLGIIREIQL